MRKKDVLILCTGNSCRSQMAEGVMRHFGSAHFNVHSAGTRPTKVNAIAIRVMDEVGIDISKQESKGMSRFYGKHFDYIITVCDNAKEVCPVMPGRAQRFHWSFPDPPHRKAVNEKVVNEFRRVRDMILEKFKKAAQSGKIE